MDPFQQVPLELYADARLHLVGASFAHARWPRLAGSFIALATQAQALRAHWEAGRAAGMRGTSRTVRRS